MHEMPYFRLWPASYPIVVSTEAPEAWVASEDVDLIDTWGPSWRDAWWSGLEISELRRRLEARRTLATSEHTMSRDETGVPLVAIVDRILGVVREAERLSHAYHLWFVGD
jgi:hypothetical protein